MFFNYIQTVSAAFIFRMEAVFVGLQDIYDYVFTKNGYYDYCLEFDKTGKTFMTPITYESFVWVKYVKITRAEKPENPFLG